MRKTLLALVCLFAAMPAAYSASNTIRPGLWEVTTTSDLLPLVQISPERMQDLKDLAEQYGVDISQIPMGEASSQVCITREMADSNTFPTFYQTELGCNTENASRNGNRFRFDFVCSSPQVKGKGAVEGAFSSPENFRGQTQFNGVAQGIPVNEQAAISGRWTNASCGNVAPL